MVIFPKLYLQIKTLLISTQPTNIPVPANRLLPQSKSSHSSISILPFSFLFSPSGHNTMDLSTFAVLLGSVLVLVYFYVNKKYHYWADLGVPFVKPRFPTGNLKGAFINTTIGERTRDFYRELKGKKSVLGGVYFFISPVAIICDLDFLKHILVKDFQVFLNRGIYYNEKSDPLSAHMFAVEDDKWLNLRTKLSPTFTSGKMKMMHSTFLLVADQFNKHLLPLAERGAELEIKELLASFTTDIIGNVAFGVECNSMKDPQSAFRRAGRRVFEQSKLQMIRLIFITTFQRLARLFNLKLTSPEVSDFFMKLVRETVDYREKHAVQRDDFLSLLMQIKNGGKLDGETVVLGKLTFEELAAQTFLFFIAGFETSSSTMTFATYELAINPEIQERARQEVHEVLQRHGGVMTYEAAMEMTYLDMLIKGKCGRVFIPTNQLRCLQCFCSVYQPFY